MDNDRSIIIVYERGSEVREIELKGSKVGSVIDTEKGTVRVYADAMTVTVPMTRLIAITQNC
jgi:hypothetical protein